jgi:hypothetical protein
MMFGGFESWLNKYGKDITVGKNSDKTLHLVMVRWTLKDDDMSRKSLEQECNSSEEEDKGYCFDKGYNLLNKEKRNK